MLRARQMALRNRWRTVASEESGTGDPDEPVIDLGSQTERGHFCEHPTGPARASRRSECQRHRAPRPKPSSGGEPTPRKRQKTHKKSRRPLTSASRSRLPSERQVARPDRAGTSPGSPAVPSRPTPVAHRRLTSRIGPALNRCRSLGSFPNRISRCARVVRLSSRRRTTVTLQSRPRHLHAAGPSDWRGGAGRQLVRRRCRAQARRRP